MIVNCDEKGRIYIPKKYQSLIHNQVYIVELKGGLWLVPIPQNPLEELRTIGKNLPKKSIAEFKDIIRSEAHKEIQK